MPAKSGSLNSSTGTIIFGNTANGSGPFQLAIARRPAFYEGTGHRKLSCCFFSPQAMCLARTSSQTSNVEEWLVASLSRLPDGSASIHLDRIAVFRRISRAILFYIDRFRTFLGGGSSLVASSPVAAPPVVCLLHWPAAKIGTTSDSRFDVSPTLLGIGSQGSQEPWHARKVRRFSCKSKVQDRHRNRWLRCERSKMTS